MNIANKTVLITGANRGIGRALVDEALRRGAKRVYAGTRSGLQNSDKRVTPLTLDVTSISQIQRAASEVGPTRSMNMTVSWRRSAAGMERRSGAPEPSGALGTARAGGVAGDTGGTAGAAAWSSALSSGAGGGAWASTVTSATNR